MTATLPAVEISPAGNRVIRGSNIVNVVGPNQVGVTINPPHTTPDGLAWVSDWSNSRPLTKTSSVDEAIDFADSWLWERT